EGAVVHQVDGSDAKPRGPEPIEGGGAAAALQMAEHGDPRLHTGAVLDNARQRLAHAAAVEPRVSEGIDLANRLLRNDLWHDDAFGDDDDGEILPLDGPPTQMLADGIQVDRHFGGEDQVRAASEPT